jgi:hypothetical protein
MKNEKTAMSTTSITASGSFARERALDQPFDPPPRLSRLPWRGSDALQRKPSWWTLAKASSGPDEVTQGS